MDNQLPLFDSTQTHESLSAQAHTAMRVYQFARYRSALECLRRVTRDLQDTNVALVGLPFVTVGTCCYNVKARKRRGMFWCYVEGTQDSERTAQIVTNANMLPVGAIKPLHPIMNCYKVAAHGVAFAHLSPLWIYALEDYAAQEAK